MHFTGSILTKTKRPCFQVNIFSIAKSIILLQFVLLLLYSGINSGMKCTNPLKKGDIMKNSLKILIISGLLPLNAFGAQGETQSTRKRPRSPGRQEHELASPIFTGNHAEEDLFWQNYAVDANQESASQPASSAAASGNGPQQQELLSPNFYQAHSDYPDYDFSAQATEPLEDYSSHPDYFQPANPASTRANELRSPNPDDYHAEDSFMQDYPAGEQQEPVSSTFSCAAAATASSAGANLPPTTIGSTNCDNQECVCKLSTKEMLLECKLPKIQQFLNKCPNRAVYRINGMPLGFILLDKVHFSQWSDMFVYLLNTCGPQAFEYQDENGKTTLHKLVSNTSGSPIVNKLYENLDNYDTQDQQGRTTPLYDAIKHLRDNYDELGRHLINRVYEKIKILLSRGATIDNKILRLTTRIPYEGTRNYAQELLHNELRSREKSRRQKEHYIRLLLTEAQRKKQSSGNQEISVPAASSSSASIVTASQQSAPATTTAAAASSAPVAQTDSQDTSKEHYIRLLLAETQQKKKPRTYQEISAASSSSASVVTASQQPAPATTTVVTASSAAPMFVAKKAPSPATLKKLYKGLSDAIVYLKNNFDALTHQEVRDAYEKISIPLYRGAIIDDKIVELVKTIPYEAIRNYIYRMLQNALFLREWARITAASASSASAVAAPQQPVSATTTAAAASPAPEPVTQTYSRDNDPNYTDTDDEQ